MYLSIELTEFGGQERGLSTIGGSGLFSLTDDNKPKECVNRKDRPRTPAIPPPRRNGDRRTLYAQNFEFTKVR